MPDEEKLKMNLGVSLHMVNAKMPGHRALSYGAAFCKEASAQSSQIATIVGKHEHRGSRQVRAFLARFVVPRRLAFAGTRIAVSDT
jgi:hypothetical protein